MNLEIVKSWLSGKKCLHNFVTEVSQNLDCKIQPKLQMRPLQQQIAMHWNFEGSLNSLFAAMTALSGQAKFHLLEE